jgi:hypothetical protein
MVEPHPSDLRLHSGGSALECMIGHCPLSIAALL